MTVDGSYKIKVVTPMTERRYKLTLETNGDSLCGTYGGRFRKQQFTDGTVNGNNVTWSTQMKGPPGGVFGRIVMTFVRAVMAGPVGGPMSSGQAGGVMGGGMMMDGGAPMGGQMRRPMGGVMRRPEGGPPMRGSMEGITLEFKGTVTGDEISGRVQVGSFNLGTFKGIRI